MSTQLTHDYDDIDVGARPTPDSAVASAGVFDRRALRQKMKYDEKAREDDRRDRREQEDRRCREQEEERKTEAKRAAQAARRDRRERARARLASFPWIPAIAAAGLTFSSMNGMVQVGMHVMMESLAGAIALTTVLEVALVWVAYHAHQLAKAGERTAHIMRWGWIIAGASGAIAALHQISALQAGGKSWLDIVGVAFFRFAVPLLACLIWHHELVKEQRQSDNAVLPTMLQRRRMREIRKLASSIFAVQRKAQIQQVSDNSIRGKLRRWIGHRDDDKIIDQTILKLTSNWWYNLNVEHEALDDDVRKLFEARNRIQALKQSSISAHAEVTNEAGEPTSGMPEHVRTPEVATTEETPGLDAVPQLPMAAVHQSLTPLSPTTPAEAMATPVPLRPARALSLQQTLLNLVDQHQDIAKQRLAVASYMLEHDSTFDAPALQRLCEGQLAIPPVSDRQYRNVVVEAGRTLGLRG